MRACAVVSCSNRGEHTFPANEALKQQWVKATRVDVQRKIGWYLRKFSSVCSNHFTPSDYETHGKRLILKKTAIPSIFPWTELSSASSSDSLDSKEAPQECPKLSFNPDNASKNYTRPEPALKFVEEYPFMGSDITEDNDDPLNIIAESDENVKNVTENDGDQEQQSDRVQIITLTDPMLQRNCATQTDHVDCATQTDPLEFDDQSFEYAQA